MRTQEPEASENESDALFFGPLEVEGHIPAGPKQVSRLHIPRIPAPVDGWYVEITAWVMALSFYALVVIGLCTVAHWLATVLP